jgi:hypothetical protein
MSIKIGIGIKIANVGTNWTQYWLTRYPTLLVATAISATRIDLAWTNNGTGYDSIIIERGTDGLTFAELATIASGVSAYSDTTVSANYYFYRVRYVKGSHYSAYSNIAYNELPLILFDGNTVALYDYAAPYLTIAGGRVTQWNDKLGSGRNLAGGGNGPLPQSYYAQFLLALGHRFETASFSYVKPAMGYFAIRQTGWQNGGRLCDGFTINTMAISQRTATPSVAMVQGAFSAEVAVPLNLWHTLRVLWNGAGSHLELDDDGAVGLNPGLTNEANGISMGCAGGTTSGSNVDWKRAVYRKISDSAQNITDIKAYVKRAICEDVWIIAGQSNCMANATVASQTIPGYNAALTGGYIWDRIAGQLALVNPGVNTTYDYPADNYYGGVFGPETSFLKDLNVATHRKQYTVKLAYGSTGIQPVIGNDWYPDSGELYSYLLGLIDNCNAYMKATKKIMRIRGVFWVQGESDAGYSAQYSANLTYFMNSLRAYCSAINTANGTPPTTVIPIIQRMSVNQAFNPADIANIRAAQELYITTYGGHYINTDAYALKVDNIHFTSDSIITMGKDAAVKVLTAFE